MTAVMGLPERTAAEVNGLSAQDPICVIAAQSGDPSAFAALYSHYRPRLLNRARFKWRLAGDAAEDLVHDTWVRALEHIADFDTGRAFEPWLFTILDNAVIDHLRTTRTGDGLPRHLSVANREIPDETAPGDSHEVDRLGDREALTRAIASLPDRQRETALGVLVSGLSVDEAAARMKLSNPACRQLLYRARRSLRRMLLEQGALPGLLPPVIWLRRMWAAACRRVGCTEASVLPAAGATAMTLAVSVTVTVAAVVAGTAANAQPVSDTVVEYQVDLSSVGLQSLKAAAIEGAPAPKDTPETPARSEREEATPELSDEPPSARPAPLVPVPSAEAPVTGSRVHQDPAEEPDYDYGLEAGVAPQGIPARARVQAERREKTAPAHDIACDVAATAPVTDCQRTPSS